MKMQKELSVYLKQILQAAQYIRLYTDKMDYGQFSADTKTVQAVVGNQIFELDRDEGYAQ